MLAIPPKYSNISQFFRILKHWSGSLSHSLTRAQISLPSKIISASFVKHESLNKQSDTTLLKDKFESKKLIN